MKKLLFLLLAAAAFAACNDDDGAPKIRYASENDAIVNGRLTGTNMTFFGTSTATNDQGAAYTDQEAYFEFAGLDDLVLYMHKTRFAGGMPPFEMRIPRTSYTGSGNSIAFSEERIVPEILIKDQGYKPMPSYALTEVEGKIDGVECRVSFTCDVPKLGVYKVTYEGKLLVRD